MYDFNSSAKEQVKDIIINYKNSVTLAELSSTNWALKLTSCFRMCILLTERYVTAQDICPEFWAVMLFLTNSKS